jgi:hypothetical protein
MVEKMDGLDKDETWESLKLSTRRNIVGRKWVFNNKLNVEGKVEKYNYFFVENGYPRVEQIDFS